VGDRSIRLQHRAFEACYILRLNNKKLWVIVSEYLTLSADYIYPLSVNGLAEWVPWCTDVTMLFQ